MEAEMVESFADYKILVFIEAEFDIIIADDIRFIGRMLVFADGETKELLIERERRIQILHRHVHMIDPCRFECHAPDRADARYKVLLISAKGDRDIQLCYVDLSRQALTESIKICDSRIRHMWKRNPTSRLYFSEQTALALYPKYERNIFNADRFGRSLKPIRLEDGIAVGYVYQKGLWTVHEIVEYDIAHDVLQISSQKWKDHNESLRFLPVKGAPKVQEHSSQFFEEEGLPDLLKERITPLVARLQSL